MVLVKSFFGRCSMNRLSTDSLDFYFCLCYALLCMEQPQPPSDPPKLSTRSRHALARKEWYAWRRSLPPSPVHTVLPQQQHPYQHYQRLSRWGFLQYYDYGAAQWLNSILGLPLTLMDLDAFHGHAVYTLTQNDMVEDRDLDEDPLIVFIMRMLVMNPADRRMTYRKAIEAECVAAGANPEDKQYLDLTMEREYWTRYDIDEMQDRLGAGLAWPIDTLLKGRDEHWPWLLPRVPGHATPTVSSWRGMKHVPVHRLLWPIVMPGDPFEPGTRPTRDASKCADLMCVNPRHFIDPRKHVKRLIQGPGKGYAGAVRTGNNIPWNIENVEVHAGGHRELHCPRCGTVAEGQIAEAINWPAGIAPTSGKMYCRNCRQIYLQHVKMFTRPNATRMPSEKRGMTAAERWEQQAYDDRQRDLDRRGRELRFDWDNDWSDGTSTRDE